MPRKTKTANGEGLLNEWNDGFSSEGSAGWSTYACKLVTPMYGGGVRAGEVDRELPIRATSIRGQLRFWWRVACGPFDSSGTMFAQECAIWGGIGKGGATASRVSVRVRNVSPVQTKPAHRYTPDPKNPGKLKSFPVVEAWADGYSLFSAQGKLARNRTDFEEAPSELALKGLTFELTIGRASTLTEQQNREIERALRWWASFGGLGARTRRGLGSIQVAGLKPVSVEEVEDREGRLVLRPSVGDATAAWKASVELLKQFRQGLGIGRNRPSAGSKNPAGRSLWPEADTLRALSRAAEPRHAKRLVPVDAFPRAAFGLPIVFHFNTFSDPGDPDDHVLEPADDSKDKKRDRMASPLILGPYWNGSGWQPSALLLPDWESCVSPPLKLKGKTYTPPHWPKDATARRALAQQVAPLRNRGDDPLTAFMRFFEEA